MNRKYLLIKSVEIYVEQITDHWYSIRPPRPVEKHKKLCASETVEYYPGIQFRLPCTPPGQFFMGAKLFIRTPWMGNEGVLKKILVWAM